VITRNAAARAAVGTALGGLALAGVGHAGGCSGGGDDYIPAQRTTIRWNLNQDLDSGFQGDGCVDLGARTMHLVVTGPTDPPDQIVDEMCANDQVVLTDQPAGNYTVALTPLDTDDVAMIDTPITQAFEVTGATEITLNVPWNAWNRPFTGSLNYTFSWGGAGCAVAMPPVLTQVLTLSIGGNPVSQTTETGQLLDGTDPKPCTDSGSGTQRVQALPIGPATFTVEGRDTLGDPQFEHTFDTFVGAGTGNPTITFDVPGPDAAPPPDAAVDALPPDAPVDAPPV
jgi:hypothetical protein